MFSPTAADDLLLAADEIEQAALVAPHHVAGMVPAAAIGLGRNLGPVEIADIELGAADQRFARLAQRHVPVLVIDEPDGDAGRLDAHGSRADQLVGEMMRHPAHDAAFGAAILVVPVEAVAFDQLGDGTPSAARHGWPAGCGGRGRSARARPSCRSAGIEAIDRISVASYFCTTSQNRETLKRRIAISVPREASEVISWIAGSA